jgi:predicted DNA-binding transcriptional regulator AlpA
MTEALLPDTGFVRIKTILKLIPIGETTWRQGVKSGIFPKPIKLGAGGNVSISVEN